MQYKLLEGTHVPAKTSSTAIKQIVLVLLYCGLFLGTLSWFWSGEPKEFDCACPKTSEAREKLTREKVIVEKEVEAEEDRSNFFDTNHECVQSKTDGLEFQELWSELPEIVNTCTVKDRLNIMAFKNWDETKYHIMPTPYALSPNKNCTIITLGVGKDVRAEKKMVKALPHCDFFGADPISKKNEDLYQEFGKFFNVAVGSSNGTMQANVLHLGYHMRDVAYIDIATFVRNHVQRKVIDQILIDIEHAEYPMLPYLLKDGQLEKDGVVVCQVNIEIHNPSAEQKEEFYNFYRIMEEENQYTMLVASTIIGHIRLFMINHANEECHQRYIGDVYDRNTGSAI